MKLDGYTTEEAATFTGLTIGQLLYWVRRGIFVPTGRQARGRGTSHRYTLEDLKQLLYLSKIKQYGISTQSIGKALQAYRDCMGLRASDSSPVLLSCKDTILALCKSKAGERVVLDLRAPGGQQIMPIVLETLQEEIQRLASPGARVEVVHE